MIKTKSVLKDILSSLELDHEVSDIRAYVFWTAVTSFRCGLASTMASSLLPSGGHQVESAGNLLPTGAKALAKLSLSSKILEASIGVAAINSLLPIDELLCKDLNAEEEIRLRAKAQKLWVFEHSFITTSVRLWI